MFSKPLYRKYQMKNVFRVILITLLSFITVTRANVGNRLVGLNESQDPYYPDRNTPKLTTPQWIGSPDIEAAAVLTIDDMAQNIQQYEAFLRPIIEHLKEKIGSAPVSIFCNSLEPNNSHLQTFLKEGLSLEVHTIDHRTPVLSKSDFAASKKSYDLGVERLFEIPGNQPVAFRFPCCDAWNSPSPRAFEQIVAGKTPDGRFLTTSSSVNMVFTPANTELPEKITVGKDGKPRFSRYLTPGFVNYIENYPYPYVTARTIWEIPITAPDDYQAQLIRPKCHEQTVEDMKMAMDAVVMTKGICMYMFHPYAWIRNDQLIDVINHAFDKYSGRVAFLTIPQIQTLIDRNLLVGQPLRDKQGRDNGVRLLDIDNDGYMDVVIANDNLRQTRIWKPEKRKWHTTDFPVKIVSNAREGSGRLTGVRFGVLRPDGLASFIVRNEKHTAMYHFNGSKWIAEKSNLSKLTLNNQPVYTNRKDRDRGVRLRDLDGDNRCEMIVANSKQNAIYFFDLANRSWNLLPAKLPDGVTLVDEKGGDTGLRFAGIYSKTPSDIIFSNINTSAVYRFDSLEKGWTSMLASTKDNGEKLPKIIRADGSANGVWIKNGQLIMQNEDTGGIQPNDIRRFPMDIFSRK
jgi:hypothetical protein